jgi:hypothetical protein
MRSLQMTSRRSTIPIPRRKSPTSQSRTSFQLRRHTEMRIQESVQDAEKLRVQQAPNRVGVWSRSQNPRGQAMSGPRFEQTIMEFQVCCAPRAISIGWKFIFIFASVIGLSEFC